jgi:hypothetical protein
MLAVTATAPPKGCAMNEEKKLSDDELKDVAGGVKNFNSSKSNTSKISGDGTKDEPKVDFDGGPRLDSGKGK